MPRKKATAKETTKKKTTQKKKAAAPKKAAATKAVKKTTAAKAAKTPKPIKAAKKTTTKAATVKKKTAAKPPKTTKKTAAKKATKTAKAAKTTRAAKKLKRTVTKENRKHLRLHYSRLISFIHYDARNNIKAPGSMAAVKDLSQTGILIETGSLFRKGDRLDMDIAFEQDTIIPAQGEVIHYKKTTGSLCKAGVKFTKIKKKDLTYLKGFVDGRLAKA